MSGYAMGRTAGERERLDMQDRVFSPHSANLFRHAGIGPGDHVLDVGCGTGATTRLLAELVGPAGSVLGIDNDPPSLEVAEEQTRASGLSNVGYRAGDLTELVLGESFDAVAGRLVLLHLSDPAAALARCAWPRPWVWWPGLARAVRSRWCPRFRRGPPCGRGC